MVVLDRLNRWRRTGRGAVSRAGQPRRRRHRDHDRLVCETLERRALLSVNVFNVNGTYTVDGHVGTLLGTLEVNTETGVVSGLDLTRRGRFGGGSAISTRTYDTQSIRSQAASGSPLRYDLRATSATETIDVRWNLPSGSLATFVGGSFTFTITNSNLGVFIPGGSGTLTLVPPPNSAPTDITLSNNTIPENSPVGTVIGTLATLDPDFNDSHTYTLVAGPGGADNAWFQIVGNTLVSAEVFDYESLFLAERTRLQVRVRSTDEGGLSTEKAFDVHVRDVNETPTAILLSNNAVPASHSANFLVGALTTSDPDLNIRIIPLPVPAIFTYSFVAGPGDTHNSLFTVVRDGIRDVDELFLVAPLAAGEYQIRLRSTDPGGLFVEASFVIVVANAAPTDIQLSNRTIPENSPVGTVVGQLATVDPNTIDSHTYTLVAGPGGADNAWFQIVGNQLRSRGVFDSETRNSYSVRIQTTDAGGLSLPKSFSITVLDVNEGPTAILLTADTFPENEPIGTLVGTFATLDPDFNDSHTYTLVAGDGSADNGSFQIVGNELRSNAVFDYESRNSYTIRVRTTDSGGLTHEQSFEIRILDGKEAPTDILLSGSTVAWDAPVGTPVGSLTAIDPDAGDWFVFSFTVGAGDADNGLFQIVGNELRTAADLKRLNRETYSIRVLVRDSEGLEFAKSFTIDVTGMPPDDPNATPSWFLPNFPNQPLRRAAWERYRGDSLIDRVEMIDLIRTTIADDNLTNPELEGLRRIVDGKLDGEYEVAMPAYVRNLAGKVVDGFKPQFAFGGFEKFGAEVEALVGKWFFGGDHPDSKIGHAPKYGYVKAEGSLFVAGPSVHDVFQGEASTCYFLAAIGAAAERYPGAIEEMFIDNGDGTWTVRFFIWRTVDNATVRFEDYVTVDRWLPVDGWRTLVFAGDGRHADDPTNELWVPLLEKAYAQWAETPDAVAPWTKARFPGSAYSVIERGLPHVAAAHILGTAPWTTRDSGGQFKPEMQAKIDAALAADRMVMLGTRLWPNDFRLVPGHLYVVQGRDMATNEYVLIQPYPDGEGGRERELRRLWESINDGNFEEIVIADASESLGNEDFLVPRGFGSGGGTAFVAPAARRPAIDLNGDGVADTLWRDGATGAVAGVIQDVAGNVIATRGLGGDLDWSIAATGDFDGDGITDFVWTQSSTGLTVMRTARSRGPIRFGGGGPAEGARSVVAAGDFDGDGRSDLIWRNDASGEHVLWLMNGHLATRQVRLGGDADWSVVVAAADFDANGDGTTDLVWRNAATGEHVVALMEGGSVIGRLPVRPAQAEAAAADWEIAASGDFSQNGRGDLLWRQRGTGVLEARPALGGPALAWAALGLGFADAGGDGQSDTVWWRTNRGLVVRRLSAAGLTPAATAINQHINFSLLAPPWVVSPTL